MTESTDHNVDANSNVPLDSAMPDWLKSLPEQSRPYAALARWDRPVGIWLLLLPCWIGLAQMRIPLGFHWIDLVWIILFAIGAIAMRGAGCTWNDIQDREIDAKVTRTEARPLPAGDVTLQQAYIFLAAQLGVGFLVWLTLPLDAKIVALLAVPMVAAYPYMKRVTWWPQAWLGFTFNFGALVGAATATNVTGATVVLYLGLVCWTVAYDTIYALQDREDDAMLGVKSTARLFGDKVLTGVFVFHMIATTLIFLGAYFAGAGRIGAVLGLAFLGHGIWQVSQLSNKREARALAIFKSNVWAGAIILAGLVIAAFL
ncbi:MAG: 4-hydroxybenzoate octaprenyltransferase [Hyphomonadaceae bacterium]|nr:4-hydroxybenzoate octaprenyltransferase [Hyphomonadaceae bacterium]